MRAILALSVSPREHTIPSLDGLRAVSIALVLLAHCADYSRSGPSPFVYYTGEIGLLGVKIFFVISGFLITTLLLKEKARTGRVSLKNFYLRRILRIFPGFYTFLLLTYLMSRVGMFPIPGRDFLHAATFTANGFGISWELLHIWSLSIEEQFYLIWPAALVLLGAKWPLRMAALTTVAPPLFFGLVVHQHVRLGEAVSGLAAGCVLAGVRQTLALHSGYQRFLTHKWTPTFLIFALFLLESARRFWFYDLLTPLVSIVITILINAVIVAPATPVGRFLNLAPVAYFGVLSYSIYLWQQIFLDKWGPFWFNAFPINLVCAILAGFLSHTLIERPFLRLKNRLTRASLRIPNASSDARARVA